MLAIIRSESALGQTQKILLKQQSQSGKLMMTSPALKGKVVHLSHYRPDMKVISQAVKKDALKKKVGDNVILSERSEKAIVKRKF